MPVKSVAPELKSEIVDPFDRSKWQIVQVFPTPTPELPPSSPTPVDPEQRYLQLREELYQLQFRINDSERRENDLTWHLQELERKIKAKQEALAALPASDSFQQFRKQLTSEIAELEERTPRLKGYREGVIRLVGQSKRALREWHEQFGEEFENCREITKALDKARL